MRARLIPWALATAGAVAASEASGQALQAGRDAVARAEQLQEAGRWPESRDLLGGALTRCGTEARSRPCRLLLSHALGYLYQRQARRDPSQAGPLLSRAVDHYRQVLEEDPGNGAALTNLAVAYRDLGREAELERLLREAITRDPGGVGLYALLLGDYYRQRGAWEAALAAYRQAMTAAPDDAEPRRRLVEVYAELPADSVVELFRVVSRNKEWQVRFPDATARAYELVVRTLSRRDRAAAVDACLRWVRLLAETQLLTADRLGAIGESWLAPEMAALQRFLADPRAPGLATSFWTTPDGRDAVGRVALAAGRQTLAAGDPAGGEAYWQVGMDAASDSPVAVDLALETAGLYHRHPALDPEGRKFRRIEEELISGKSAAYARADAEAMQRFHSTLGMIYADRGVWGSSGHPWSAVYQLEHALETAARRDRAARVHQPLAQLRLLLAEAYAATGRPGQARAAYLDAAQAFLDIDDVQQSRRTLTEARRVPGGAADSGVSALEELLRVRAAFGAGSPQRPAAAACDTVARRAVRAAGSASLPPSFLARQHFKLHADCVLEGSGPIDPHDAARVVHTVVEDRIPLVGARDLLRLEKSKAAIERAVRVAGEASHGDFDQPDERRPGIVLPLSIPGEARPSYITLSPDAVLGVRILVTVGPKQGAARLYIQNGVVTVLASDTSAAVATLTAQIGRVTGVQAVRLRPPD